MTNEELKQKATYLRSLGYSALADDLEQLIVQINELKKENHLLDERIKILLGQNKWRYKR